MTAIPNTLRRTLLLASLLLSTAAAATPAAAAATLAGAVHAHLTPLSMFLDADIVVKAIMVGLAAASVVTWTIAIGKTIEIALSRRRLKKGLADLTRFKSLAEAQQSGSVFTGVTESLLWEAATEYAIAPAGADKAGVEARIASRLADIEDDAGRAMRSGTGLLATIGSTGPFVGLLGTVWGIMNSFIGITQSNTTNLAVVAPGIAEALLATAIGLVAAIPAVVVHNVLARKIGSARWCAGAARKLHAWRPGISTAESRRPASCN